MISEKRLDAMLFWGFAAVLAAAAGLRDLWAPDEPRFAQIAREMLQSGVWAVPRLNGEVYTDKPPLFMWIVAAASKLFFGGEVTAFAARLPSLLGALGCLWLTRRLGGRMFGDKAGFFAVVVLATCYRFWMNASWAQLDMLLCFFILAALACFWFAFTGENLTNRPRAAGLWSLFYLSLAGGFLTKGPIGILFPCGIIFIFLLWERRLAFLLKMWIPLGCAMLAAVVGVWVWAAWFDEGKAYLYEHFIVHNFVRYTDPWGHVRPFYYYFLHFPVDALPWIFFLPVALKRSWRERFRPSPGKFLAVWFLLIFIFFSLSESKRNLYLLPLFPAFALFLGDFFARASSPRVQKGFSLAAAAGAAAFALALPAVFPIANAVKSARPFCEEVKAHLGEDGRLGTFGFFKEAYLFYIGGKPFLERIETEEELSAFLAAGSKNFALVPSRALEKIEGKIPFRILADEKVGHRHVYLIGSKDEK